MRSARYDPRYGRAVTLFISQKPVITGTHVWACEVVDLVQRGRSGRHIATLFPSVPERHIQKIHDVERRPAYPTMAPGQREREMALDPRGDDR